MKRAWWLVLLLFVSLLACRSSHWQEFTSKDGHFAITFPGEPREDSPPVDPKSGMVAQKSFLVDQGSLAFAVMYVDYPPSLVSAGTGDAILDGAVQGAVGAEGKLAQKQDIRLGEYSGREFSAAHQGFEHHARIYLVRNRLYQLIVTARPGAVKPEDELKFFSSFKLVP